MSQNLPAAPRDHTHVHGAPAHGVCLVLTIAATLVLGCSAWAGNSSGTLQLTATVPTVCTVAVTSSNATLDLVNGQNAVTVGSVTEQCNAGNGYTVSVASANSGTLKSSATGSTAVAYSLSYDNTAAAKNGTLTTDRAGSTQSRQGTLAVSLPGNNQAAAGVYQDTVTVSIAAK
ncbi:spore coat protein U domain-containing protein [Nitrospirillum sp. BR 11828]|uniref:spore coat protein U domain-containing protein n=1 Tax=Nitrospirillum sp. BR 11828 TaxID=3104325 RepID=UPI002ACA4878|nr:spore coat protein U domain-containing protein [Nitrospirillum sp. BR 11828]MDZ5649342.1 spore coat protein U domain-containing protein [Nitrospirillum sp. BR 11828]